jgi:hypothetical protein
MMLGYPDDKFPNKITVTGCGNGGWKEMLPCVPEVSLETSILNTTATRVFIH